MLFLSRKLPILYRNIQDSAAIAVARASGKMDVETERAFRFFSAAGA